jgi:hypothetical protein
VRPDGPPFQISNLRCNLSLDEDEYDDLNRNNRRRSSTYIAWNDIERIEFNN